MPDELPVSPALFTSAAPNNLNQLSVRIYHSIEEFESPCRPAVTVGVFDGVHRGHWGIIERLVCSAREKNCESVVITFNPHPRLVLGNAEGVRLLQSLDEKLARFSEAGVDVVLVIPFDASFANIDSSDFIRKVLVDIVRASKVITGHDHMFGHGRQGDFALLEEMGRTYNFEVEQVTAIEHCGRMVSSSAIRNAIIEGNLEMANCMLGYQYTLTGKVVRGNQLGKLIGFPTANIELLDKYKLLPSNGVYASLVLQGGVLYRGMSNIGTRPTIDANKLTIEVNIFDFDDDIYNETLVLKFVHRIRDEKKFGGLEQLKEQLSLDKERVKYLLDKDYQYGNLK
ncbi:MAG: bifunctional riboflavin kinase/FAD synthetase [Bacteroidetes bacterium]|nr:bifunctional riboflavin kinase/FAD synthetase [Bacteroidota bacterium]